MDKRELDHATKVFSSFLEARENAPTFFQPANKLFHDRTAAVGIAVKVDLPRSPVFVALRRNDWLDVQLQKVFVNPIGSIAFISRHRNWPCNWVAVEVDDGFIGSFQQSDDRSRFVSLARSEMEVQRVSVAVGEQMDFCRKTPTGAT